MEKQRSKKKPVAPTKKPSTASTSSSIALQLPNLPQQPGRIINLPMTLTSQQGGIRPTGSEEAFQFRPPSLTNRGQQQRRSASGSVVVPRNNSRILTNSLLPSQQQKAHFSSRPSLPSSIRPKSSSGTAGFKGFGFFIRNL